MKTNYYNVGGSAKSTDGIGATAIISETGKSYSSDLHSKDNSILFSPQNFTTMEKSYNANGSLTSHGKNSSSSSSSFFKTWAFALVFFVFGIGSVIGQCTHTIRLTDTYGDGWNGGRVAVSVNNVVVLTNLGATFTGGAGPISFNFTATAGQTIRVYRTAAGSYSSEMRIQVVNPAGVAIINTIQPLTGTATSGGRTGVASCPAAQNTVPSIGNNSYTLCSGVLYDHAGSTGNYAANVNGYTVINPSIVGNMVRLTGNITTEASYDYVRIFNGVGTAGALLYQGSGNASIGTITSTSGPLTVQFTSDGSVQYAGFALNIACVAVTPVIPLCAATPTAPANGATGVAVSPTLSWAAVANATGYDVYFGTANPATTLVSTNQAGLTYAPTGLLGNTTYYWKIVPRSSAGSAAGCATWSFVTTVPGCGSATAFGSGPAPAPGTTTQLTTCAFAGEYSTITVVPAATTFTSTGTGGSGNYITIRKTTSAGTIIAAGFSPLTWTSTGADTYVQIVNTNAACGTESACHTLSVSRASAPCAGTPNPGATTASTSQVFAGGSTTLGIATAQSGTGISYQWQSGPSVTGPWTAIGGATSATYVASPTAATYYRCIVTCSNGGANGSSTPILISFNAYCNPDYTGYTGTTPQNGNEGTVDGDMITNVTITLGATTLLNNASTTALSSPQYTFYSSLPTVTMYPSNTYNVNVTAGAFTNQNFAVWIDYNDDNDFSDAGELIGFSSAATTVAYQIISFPINLACAPPLGTHRMRIRDAFFTVASTMDPCATYGWGETEDYLITIVAGTSFTPTFTATPTNPSCTNNQLTYTAPSGQTNYSWTFPGVATVDYVLVSGGTATSNTSLVTYLTSGSKTVTLNYSSPLGCASSGAVNNVITVNTTPTVTTVNTASICSGSATNISLTASVASTYAWSVGTITGSITGASSGVGATIAQTLTNPSNSAAGTVQYLVTPTATTGSCAGLAYTITVTVNPSPTVTTANTASICSGNATNISLTASVASAYTWTIGTVTGSITGATQSLGTGTSISQTLTNPSSSVVGTVEYIVTPTAATGSCAGAAYSITVTVNPKPVIANITSSICSGNAFIFTPSTGGGSSSNDIVPANTTYTWSAPSVIGITGTSAGTSAPNISGTATNTTNAPINVVYTVTPTALIGTCAGATFTVTVTVNPTPAALLLTGSIVCFTTPTTITSSTSQSDINYQLYNSSGAVGSVLPGDGNGLTWSAMAAGNGYYVIGTNTGTACASVASSTVNVVLNANTNTIQTNLGGVTLGAGDYLWNGSVSLLWENPANWFEFIGSNFVATANVPQDNDRVFILTNFTVGSTCINMDVLNPVSVSVNGAANGLAKDVYIGTGAYMTIAQDETLTVKGNWTNHGTFTANSGSSVVFEGSGAKEIRGSTPTTFNNLTVNKTSGGSLTLQTPVIVAGTLTMTAGEIVTRISVTPDVTNLLTVGTSSTTGSTGSITWTGGTVLGPIKRYFSEVESLTQSSGIFPVGYLNLVSGLVSNRNAQVNYTANLGTGGSITAEYKSGETPVGDIVIPNPPGPNIVYQNYAGLPAFVNGHMIQNYENEGYWEINPERDIFNQPVGDLNTAEYSLKLRGNNLSAVTSIPAMSQLRMIKSTSHTGWDNVGIGSYSFPADIDLTGGVSDFTITNRLMTGFSWFNIGSGQISWLPVELTNFAANCNEKSQVDLKWSTASEQNSENFIIERSRDLTQWEFVSTINAAGNSNYNINYSTVDTDPIGGISYYRLVQVDNNGAEKIYGPISVSCSDAENSIIVFPNPTQGNFTVEISSTEIFTNAQLQITDLTGKIIHQRSTNILEGKNQFTFEGLDLQLGTYIINLNSVNGKINPVRIVVQ
jgi:hypothetical protein